MLARLEVGECPLISHEEEKPTTESLLGTTVFVLVSKDSERWKKKNYCYRPIQFLYVKE